MDMASIDEIIAFIKWRYSYVGENHQLVDRRYDSLETVVIEILALFSYFLFTSRYYY